MQEGSEGWRVAQVREVIKGWAGEVMGEIVLSVGERVGVLGKSVGEMKGLVVCK
jgi:hypothetical protein